MTPTDPQQSDRLAIGEPHPDDPTTRWATLTLPDGLGVLRFYVNDARDLIDGVVFDPADSFWSAVAKTGERSSDESEPLPDCSCAMTEASMWSCPIHGLESSEELLAAWDAAQAAAKSRSQPPLASGQKHEQGDGR